MLKKDDHRLSDLNFPRSWKATKDICSSPPSQPTNYVDPISIAFAFTADKLQLSIPYQHSQILTYHWELKIPPPSPQPPPPPPPPSELHPSNLGPALIVPLLNSKKRYLQNSYEHVSDLCAYARAWRIAQETWWWQSVEERNGVFLMS